MKKIRRKPRRAKTRGKEMSVAEKRKRLIELRDKHQDIGRKFKAYEVKAHEALETNPVWQKLKKARMKAIEGQEDTLKRIRVLEQEILKEVLDGAEFSDKPAEVDGKAPSAEDAKVRRTDPEADPGAEPEAVLENDQADELEDFDLD